MEDKKENEFDEEIEHLLELRHTFRRRLMILQQKEAFQGQSTPPEVTMEIEDINQKVDDIDRKLIRTIKIARYTNRVSVKYQDLQLEDTRIPEMSPPSITVNDKWWHNTFGLRAVFNLNYTNSPFLHGWHQYAGSNDVTCLNVIKDGVLNDLVLYKSGGFANAVSYPEIGTWLRLKDSIYILPVRPDGNFHIYFNVFTENSNSNYLIYTNSGNTRMNVNNEQEVVIESEDIYNGAWRFLVFDIEAQVKKYFESPFVHLNWICLRGNFHISEMIAVSSGKVLDDIWNRLHSPILVKK